MTNATKQKTPVFFVATRFRNKPMTVNFFETKTGKPVLFQAVKKVKTKEGVRFYATRAKTG